MKFSRRGFLQSSAVAAASLALPAEARFPRGNVSIAAFEGLVASRARMLLSIETTNKYLMSRSAHVATDNISSLKVAFSNFYITGGGDLGVGAASTITASVEYPAATFTQILFSGVASGTIPDADLLFSDYTTVSIPQGATFWIRSFVHNTAGLMYNSFQNSFLGEATALSVTAISDQTMSGTITNSGAFSFPPAAILGMTRTASVMIVGDSIAYGTGDVEDSSSSATGYDGKVGTVARSMGSTPFVNLSRFGEFAVGWGVSAATIRAKLLQKSSHVFCELGTNDIHTNGTSSATLIGYLQLIYARTLSGQKVYQTTITPFTTSTDGWMTTVNQTPNANNSIRVTFNTAVRSGLSGTNYVGYVEVANILESAQNSGLWTVTPSPPYTTDGAHPDVAGYAKVAAANVYPTITFP